jgi:hypothetical protein
VKARLDNEKKESKFCTLKTTWLWKYEETIYEN